MHLIRNPWCFAAVCSVLLQIWTVGGAEKIISLPGHPKVNFEQYSGYIHINEPHESERALFYYFAEAQSDPASKPLVLWLSGGVIDIVACSSLMQLFSEHGPFKPTESELLENKYSWNKAANILYLDFPVGVGFSYSKNESYYRTTNDDVTARDNLRFLINWLEKFPQYKMRDFYSAGNNYGGHFVPQLALLVAQSKTLNLKGIAIGNPQLDFDIDYNSEAKYIWMHGAISDTAYNMLNNVCNVSTVIRQTVDHTLSKGCIDVIKIVQGEETEDVDVCIEFETEDYLKRKDVQEALHARLVGTSYWRYCNPLYSVEDLELPITPALINLTKLGIRVLLYSGDQDTTYTFIGTRRVANNVAVQLGLNVTASPYRAWFVGRQVGEWTQDYSPYLSFATIRGAGQKAALSQPKRSLELFSSFVNGKPLPKAVLT